MKSQKRIKNSKIVQVQLIDRNIKYPTELYLFMDTHLTPELIREIIDIGPSQPGLKDNYNDFSKDESGRYFNVSWYTKKQAKSNMDITRKWLVYLTRANSMYCFPWLPFCKKM